MIISGLLGLVGGLIPKGLEMLGKHQERKHELKLLDLQMKLGKQESESEMAVAEMAAFEKSYTLDTGLRDASPWVKNINAMVRPGITFFLVFSTALIIFINRDPVLITAATTTLLDLVVMSLAWWFGSRGVDKLKS